MLLTIAIAALLQIGGQILEVEIADTPASRQRGLMGRKSLPEGTGMLFVFEKPAYLSFWMKDTFIPLSIGFFAADKTLLGTADMAPLPRGAKSTPSYDSPGPAQYALEVPQGWFEKNRIEPGMKFTLHDQE